MPNPENPGGPWSDKKKKPAEAKKAGKVGRLAAAGAIALGLGVAGERAFNNDEKPTEPASADKVLKHEPVENKPPEAVVLPQDKTYAGETVKVKKVIDNIFSQRPDGGADDIETVLRPDRHKSFEDDIAAAGDGDEDLQESLKDLLKTIKEVELYVFRNFPSLLSDKPPQYVDDAVVLKGGIEIQIVDNDWSGRIYDNSRNTKGAVVAIEIRGAEDINKGIRLLQSFQKQSGSHSVDEEIAFLSSNGLSVFNE